MSIRKTDNFRRWRVKGERRKNQRLTIEELSNTLNQPRSIVQEHFQQIGKVPKAGVWVPHNLSEENKAIDQPLAIYCFDVTIQKCFSIAWSQEMKNGSSVITLNAKDSGSLRMNRHEVLPSLVYIPKRIFCLSGRLFAKLFNSKCWNVDNDLSREHLDRANKFLIEKYSAICNRKGVILQHDTSRPHCARRTLEKINELEWEVMPLTILPRHCTIEFRFILVATTLFLWRKIWKLHDIQNGISRYFAQIDGTLKIFTLDGKKCR